MSTSDLTKLQGPASEARVSRARDWLSLLKPRTLGLMVLVSLAAAWESSGGRLSWQAGLLLALGGGMAAAGAAALNHCLERDLDRLMARTRARPLAAGRLHLRQAAAVGVGLIVLGTLVGLALSVGTAFFTLVGVAIYVGVYTVCLKRRTWLGAVVGGGAGSCAALAGAAAAGPLGPLAWPLALVVFLWTPAHFWGLALAHREDFRHARLPVLPALVGPRSGAIGVLAFSALTVLAALSLRWPLATAGPGYGVAAAALGVAFLGVCAWLVAHPSPRWAEVCFKLSGLYLVLLLSALVLAS